MSYRAGGGIKLSCQLLEDRETCDRWHLVYVFACWFFINVCHLPFKEVAKKGSQKEGSSFLYFARCTGIVGVFVKNRESLARPWERVMGKLSRMPPRAGRDRESPQGGSLRGARDGQHPRRVGSRHTARAPKGGNPTQTSPKDLGRHREPAAIVGQSTSLKEITHPASEKGR